LDAVEQVAHRQLQRNLDIRQRMQEFHERLDEYEINRRQRIKEIQERQHECERIRQEALNVILERGMRRRV
jgi:hypothetical protein